MTAKARAIAAPDAEEVPAASVEEEFRDFSYIVSHDLATSLRHMSEFSRLLVADLGDGLSERQRAHADHVRAAAERCQQMTEQLLVFSRVQQKPLELVRQNANPSVQLALLQLAAKVQTAGVEVSVDQLGDAWADPKLLSLAIRHLLDNAIKFRQPGVTPRIFVRPAHDRLAWRMRISDNGPGVEPAFREKAFRMFQRLHADDTLPGVGAGLAITRRIARRHGGEARLVDAAEGACVELSLPHG